MEKKGGSGITAMFFSSDSKKLVFILAMILFLCIFALLNMVSIYFFSIPFSPVAITGRVVDTGLVNLYVEGSPKVITIYPENTTYDNDSYTCSGAGDLGKCSDFRYNFTLNVSADFFVEEVNGWKYSLYDLEHSVYVEENTYFDPNTTISAVRWGNLLTVYANEKDVGWQSQEVVFTVEVTNSSPLLGDINETILVCEGQRLDYRFNASDVDEETLTGDLTPKNGTFYVSYIGPSGNNVSLFQIVSGSISKSEVDNYNKTISVTDPTDGVDTAVTNISVIEINNPPIMISVSPSSQTVWMEGADSTFYHQMNVTDVENGVSADGNLTFNLTWDYGDLFEINSTTGVMNYTPSFGQEGRTYSLTVCVNDTALGSTHENISFCYPRSGEIESVCDSFTLTVTNANRAPVMVRNSPSTADFSVGGTTATIFNVSVSDDDMTVSYPDIDWYVNSVLQESNENKSSDDFSFSAGCGASGIYNVSAITNDGLLSDSVSWNVTVTLVACPAQEGGGGGGSGGGTLAGYCKEKWVCDDWEVCQNVERSFIAKSLSPEDYFRFKELCSQNKYDNRFCGFQITSCKDLESCKNKVPKIQRPSEMRVCYFTEDPNCIDGITNCHDGSCELLVDCGGPCEPCPTCSDGKRNQGEGGVDCGGPCPYSCEVEEAFSDISFVLIGLLVVSFVVFVFIIIKLFSIVKYRFFTEKRRRVSSAVRKKRKI